MLYSQYETMKLSLQPLSHFLNRSIAVMDSWDQMFPHLSLLNNYHHAKFSLTNNLIKDYPKMPWGLTPIIDKDGVSHDIREEVIISKTFCEFKLFSLTDTKDRHALFMVAPLSGHYATLLRDTLQTFLKDFDVYITDWVNCKNIPVSEGDFGFDDYVAYVIEFSKYIKNKHKEVNVLAVCQPTVPVAVAAAYLAKHDPNYQFDNIVLMGGPLDTRISPTQVNEYAFKNSLDWFKSNVIKTVPMYFKGYGRKVYPGFLQHMGFLSMNMKRHTQAHVDFFNHLLIGANLDAKKHEEFYNEYNAVMDLPAPYYLETLAHVFIDQSLAKDKMEVFGEKISMSDIKEGNYLLLEGELDDISGPGQTHAAYDMLSNVPQNNKQKYLAENVGHYGIFSGSGFRNNIYPKIKSFILKENIPLNKKGDVIHIEKLKKEQANLNSIQDEIVNNLNKEESNSNTVKSAIVSDRTVNNSIEKPSNINSKSNLKAKRASKSTIVKLSANLGKAKSMDNKNTSSNLKDNVAKNVNNISSNHRTDSALKKQAKLVSNEEKLKLNMADKSSDVDLGKVKEDNIKSSLANKNLEISDAKDDNIKGEI